MINNNSVLLTSHMMEEVDVLCHRIGVISEGIIRSVDKPQTLKAQVDPSLHLRIDIKPT